MGVTELVLNDIELGSAAIKAKNISFSYGSEQGPIYSIKIEDLEILYSLEQLQKKRVQSASAKKVIVTEIKAGVPASAGNLKKNYLTIPNLKIPLESAQVEALELTISVMPNDAVLSFNGHVEYTDATLKLYPQSQLKYEITSDTKPVDVELRNISDVVLSQTDNDHAVSINPFKIKLDVTQLLAPLNVSEIKIDFDPIVISQKGMNINSHLVSLFSLPGYKGLESNSFRTDMSLALNEVAGLSFALKNTQLDSFGGQILFSAINYKPSNNSTTFLITLKNIDLKNIFDLYPDHNISGTGELSGKLPVQIKNNVVTISDGKLESSKKGGVLKSDLSGWVAAHPDNKGIIFAADALRNFHYTVLKSAVEYDKAGKLKAAVSLTGSNSEKPNGQLYNLNINIEENIPALIRTLELVHGDSKALKNQIK